MLKFLVLLTLFTTPLLSPAQILSTPATTPEVLHERGILARVRVTPDGTQKMLQLGFDYLLRNEAFLKVLKNPIKVAPLTSSPTQIQCQETLITNCIKEHATEWLKSHDPQWPRDVNDEAQWEKRIPHELLENFQQSCQGLKISCTEQPCSNEGITLLTKSLGAGKAWSVCPISLPGVMVEPEERTVGGLIDSLSAPVPIDIRFSNFRIHELVAGEVKIMSYVGRQLQACANVPIFSIQTDLTITIKNSNRTFFSLKNLGLKRNPLGPELKFCLKGKFDDNGQIGQWLTVEDPTNGLMSNWALGAMFNLINKDNLKSIPEGITKDIGENLQYFYPDRPWGDRNISDREKMLRFQEASQKWFEQHKSFDIRLGSLVWNLERLAPPNDWSQQMPQDEEQKMVMRNLSVLKEVDPARWQNPLDKKIIIKEYFSEWNSLSPAQQDQKWEDLTQEEHSIWQSVERFLHGESIDRTDLFSRVDKIISQINHEKLDLHKICAEAGLCSIRDNFHSLEDSLWYALLIGRTGGLIVNNPLMSVILNDILNIYVAPLIVKEANDGLLEMRIPNYLPNAISVKIQEPILHLRDQINMTAHRNFFQQNPDNVESDIKTDEVVAQIESLVTAKDFNNFVLARDGLFKFLKKRKFLDQGKDFLNGIDDKSSHPDLAELLLRFDRNLEKISLAIQKKYKTLVSDQKIPDKLLGRHYQSLLDDLAQIRKEALGIKVAVLDQDKVMRPDIPLAAWINIPQLLQNGFDFTVAIPRMANQVLPLTTDFPPGPEHHFATQINIKTVNVWLDEKYQRKDFDFCYNRHMGKADNIHTCSNAQLNEGLMDCRFSASPFLDYRGANEKYPAGHALVLPKVDCVNTILGSRLIGMTFGRLLFGDAFTGEIRLVPNKDKDGLLIVEPHLENTKVRMSTANPLSAITGVLKEVTFIYPTLMKNLIDSLVNKKIESLATSLNIPLYNVQVLDMKVTPDSTFFFSKIETVPVKR
ncbi:MAG: hypothetical protein WCG27_00845 [Pseudomonadota bacterium]